MYLIVWFVCASQFSLSSSQGRQVACHGPIVWHSQWVWVGQPEVKKLGERWAEKKYGEINKEQIKHKEINQMSVAKRVAFYTHIHTRTHTRQEYDTIRINAPHEILKHGDSLGLPCWRFLPLGLPTREDSVEVSISATCVQIVSIEFQCVQIVSNCQVSKCFKMFQRISSLPCLAFRASHHMDPTSDESNRSIHLISLDYIWLVQFFHMWAIYIHLSYEMCLEDLEVCCEAKHYRICHILPLILKLNRTEPKMKSSCERSHDFSRLRDFYSVCLQHLQCTCSGFNFLFSHFQHLDDLERGIPTATNSFRFLHTSNSSGAFIFSSSSSSSLHLLFHLLHLLHLLFFSFIFYLHLAVLLRISFAFWVQVSHWTSCCFFTFAQLL